MERLSTEKCFLLFLYNSVFFKYVDLDERTNIRKHLYRVISLISNCCMISFLFGRGESIDLSRSKQKDIKMTYSRTTTAVFLVMCISLPQGKTNKYNLCWKNRARSRTKTVTLLRGVIYCVFVGRKVVLLMKPIRIFCFQALMQFNRYFQC